MPTVGVTAFSHSVVFGSPITVIGPQTINISAFSHSVSFGSPITVSAGTPSQTVTPAAFQHAVQFGSPITVSAAGAGMTVGIAAFSHAVVFSAPSVSVGSSVSTSETVRTWQVNKRSRAIRFRLTMSGPSSMAKLRSIEVARRDVGRS